MKLFHKGIWMALCTAETSNVGLSLEYDDDDGSQASTRRKIFSGPIFSKSKCLFVHFVVILFPYSSSSVLKFNDQKNVVINLSDFFTLKLRYGRTVAGSILLVQP